VTTFNARRGSPRYARRTRNDASDSRTRTAAAPWAPMRRTEIDHDQRNQKARARAPLLTARLRACSLQRLRILRRPRTVAEPVLPPGAVRSRAAHYEVRQADADLGGGRAALAASPRARGRSGGFGEASSRSPISQESSARSCGRQKVRTRTTALNARGVTDPGAGLLLLYTAGSCLRVAQGVSYTLVQQFLLQMNRLEVLSQGGSGFLGYYDEKTE